MNGQWAAETLTAQALGEVDAASGAITPAIHPSTSYERNADGTYRSGLAYTRSDNPTYDHAERLLTTLESGASCMLFASGSAAATAVFQALLPRVPEGYELHEQRLDETEVGKGTTVTLVDGKRPPDWLKSSKPEDVAKGWGSYPVVPGSWPGMCSMPS